MAKDQIPVLTLNPTEPPLRVASALGRPVAIVRIGRPPADHRGNPGRRRRRHRPRLGREHRLEALPVPVSERRALPAAVRAGAASASPPPARPSLPRDEYLCDGGDRGDARGGQRRRPRSAASNRATRRPVRHRRQRSVSSRESCRPTSSASTHPGSPKFASAPGTNQNIDIQTTKTDKTDRQVLARPSSMADSRRLVQNQAAELARARTRASGPEGAADGQRRLEQPRAQQFRCRDTLAASNLAETDRRASRNRQKLGQVKETASP